MNINITMPVWMEIIEAVGKKSPQTIAQINKKVDRTYSHTYKVILELKEKSVILINKKGKTSEITLTGKGKQISRYLMGIRNLMSIESHFYNRTYLT